MFLFTGFLQVGIYTVGSNLSLRLYFGQFCLTSFILLDAGEYLALTVHVFFDFIIDPLKPLGQGIWRWTDSIVFEVVVDGD